MLSVPRAKNNWHSVYSAEPIYRLLSHLVSRNCHSILEIGTGDGGLTACLASTGAAVTTIDSHLKIHRAFQTDEYRKAFPLARIEWYLADSDKFATQDFLKQKNGDFDAVIWDGDPALIESDLDVYLPMTRTLFAIMQVSRPELVARFESFKQEYKTALIADSPPEPIGLIFVDRGYWN